MLSGIRQKQPGIQLENNSGGKGTKAFHGSLWGQEAGKVGGISVLFKYFLCLSFHKKHTLCKQETQ